MISEKDLDEMMEFCDHVDCEDWDFLEESGYQDMEAIVSSLSSDLKRTVKELKASNGSPTHNQPDSK